MKEKAFEILLMYIEIERQADIEDELVKGLENKQPKVVQACLEILRRGLTYVRSDPPYTSFSSCLRHSEFGSKVLPIKPFLKQVIPLLDDRDKSVRDEAKLLLVEIYKWIGKQTLTPMIQNVKPIQVGLFFTSEIGLRLIVWLIDARAANRIRQAGLDGRGQTATDTIPSIAARSQTEDGTSTSNDHCELVRCCRRSQC
jgi:hypothetical protein